MTETTRPPGVAFYGKVRIPTIGHKKAIETAQGIAKKTGGQLHIGLSGTSHPLTSETKREHAEALFGHPVETGVPHTSNLFSYLGHLSQHHDEIHLVAGSDRAPEYRKTLQQWNGKADKSGKVGFNFKKWKVHEVEGKREDSGKHPTKMKPDELERSVSATKLEGLARGGDYEGFRAYHPGLPEKHVKKVYNQIRMAPTEAPKPKSVKAIKAKVVKEEEESASQYWQKNPPPDSPITRAASNLPVISQAKAVKSAVDNVRQGKYADAALDIAGEIPKVGLAIGAARVAGAALREESLDDIGELDHEKFGPMLDTFVQFASKKLGIKSMPTMQLQKGEMGAPSFGGYNPQNQSIAVVSKNRHPMDIFRTVAHELVHHKQKEDGRIGKDISNEGATGSPFENEANSEAGKIMRWFAQKNPEAFKSGYVVEETQLTEGINDPGTFKAVFLAGGPGSGKDYVMKQTLDGMGLQEINSDVAFEYLMKKAGLNFKMPESERYERDIARGKAKKLTKERERLALAGRRGLIINGTADDPEKIASIKKELEALGYDTMMVFVNTSDKVSKERNIGRGDQGGRTVPEDIRKDKWEACQAAMPVLKNLFGKDNFVAVDNSNDLRTASPEVKKKVEGEFQSIFKMTKKFVGRQPIENEKAATWTQNEMQKRNMQSFVPPSSTAFGTGSVQRGAVQSVALPVDQNAPAQATSNQAPTSDEMSQAQRLGLTYYGFGRYGTTIKGKHTVTYLSQNGKLVPKQQQVAEDLRKWFDAKDPEGGWKRINSKGEAIGPCAREPGEPKPKCMSNEKRAKLSKKERASAVAAKRRHDPNPERKGEPINVSNFGKGKISEACWTGYEQRGTKKKGNRVVPNCVPVKESNAAAIAAATAIAKKKSGNYDKDGLRVKPYKNPDAPNVKSNDERRREMKKEEYLQEKNVPTNPQLWARAKSMAKSKFDVYPSAYANGWASKWYKSKGGGWKTQADESFEHMVNENTPSDREWGTDSLTKIYKEGTPGQTFPANPLSEKMGKKKIVKKAKKLAQEDNSLALGYEFGNNGIGQEFGVVRSPNGLGYGYSMPMDGSAFRLSESVQAWMNKESTIERYISKYGEQAERKLYESAVRLSQLEETNGGAKGFDSIREAWEALGGRDMGTVAKTGKEEMPEQSVMAAYMPHKADYNAKFDVKDPQKAAQYDKMRALKHAHAQEYESQHSEKSMIGDKEEPRAKELKESPAWQRKEGKNPEGGLNKKGIESYRRENPGSKLSLAVTTKPSKLKKGSKAANRRKSFCARMSGMKKRLTSAKTANDPDSRINKSLRKWNCEE